jgi:glutaminase
VCRTCPNSLVCTSFRWRVARGRRCEPCTNRDNVRVYETHGDLLSCSAEQVVRTVDRDRDDFDVAILDVSRVDEIDDVARNLLSGMTTVVRAQGKEGYLVDPAGIVIRTETEFEAVRYLTVDDAVEAATRALRAG